MNVAEPCFVPGQRGTSSGISVVAKIGGSPFYGTGYYGGGGLGVVIVILLIFGEIPPLAFRQEAESAVQAARQRDQYVSDQSHSRVLSNTGWIECARDQP